MDRDQTQQYLWISNLAEELEIVKSPKSGTGRSSCETACIDGCINVHGGREKVSLQQYIHTLGPAKVFRYFL